jgi:hypothetical protein
MRPWPAETLVTAVLQPRTSWQAATGWSNAGGRLSLESTAGVRRTLGLGWLTRYDTWTAGDCPDGTARR